jgi:hypothetical protein
MAVEEWTEGLAGRATVAEGGVCTDAVDCAEAEVVEATLDVESSLPFSAYGTNFGDLFKDGGSSNLFLHLSSSSSSSNAPESPSQPELLCSSWSPSSIFLGSSLSSWAGTLLVLGFQGGLAPDWGSGVAQGSLAPKLPPKPDKPGRHIWGDDGTLAWPYCSAGSAACTGCIGCAGSGRTIGAWMEFVNFPSGDQELPIQPPTGAVAAPWARSPK